jgi:hypothetical protein
MLPHPFLTVIYEPGNEKIVIEWNKQYTDESEITDDPLQQVQSILIAENQEQNPHRNELCTKVQQQEFRPVIHIVESIDGAIGEDPPEVIAKGEI